MVKLLCILPLIVLPNAFGGIQLPRLGWDYTPEEQAILESYDGHFEMEREHTGVGDWAVVGSSAPGDRTIDFCSLDVEPGHTNWRMRAVSADGATYSDYAYIDASLFSTGIYRAFCFNRRSPW